MAFLSRQRGTHCCKKKKKRGTVAEIEKERLEWVCARDSQCEYRCAWIYRCVCVHASGCMFAYSGCMYKFQPETLLLIQLAVGPYEIAPGKYLHYSLPIASLMAGAECSIVAR